MAKDRKDRRRSAYSLTNECETMTTITLSLLGKCSIELGDQELKPDSPLLFFLLLYLSVECGRPILRSELIDLIFPDVGDQKARSHSLRQLLYRLRRNGAPLQFDGKQVFVAPQKVTGGLPQFLSASLEARARQLERTIVVLPHYTPPTVAASEWIELLRDRWHSAIRRQLNDDLQAFRQRADWRSVEMIARRVLEMDPLNESATLFLAEAIARTGSKTLALSLLSKYEADVERTEPHLTIPATVLRKRIVGIAGTTRGGSLTQLPLVGRTAEIGRLTREWNACRQGCFRVMSVSGDRLVGKTRILEELSALIGIDASGYVIWSRPSESDRDRPLALFADIAKQMMSLPGAAGCDPNALSLLRTLTQATSPNGPIGSSFAHSRYDEACIRDSICELIASVCEEHPLLCLIDSSHDLHDSSVAMLKAVRLRAPKARALFAIAQRTRAGANALVSDGIGTALHLQPLSESDSRELLRAMQDSENGASEDREVAWLLEAAGGNPGHLELLLSSVSSGHPSSRMPADIVALVDEQISTLSPVAQHVLQALGISGHMISLTALERITGLSDYAMVSALSEVDDASLIRHDGCTLACRSALIAERSLKSASPLVLRLMHERAARLLEEEHGRSSGNASLAWRISGHWQAAGQPQNARTFLRACWQQAIDVGQPMLACESIRKELSTCSRPDDKASLLDDLIGALQASGELNLLYTALGERRALSKAIADSDERIASLEFDQIDAERVTHGSPAKYRNSLLEHLSRPYLDTPRRLRAARLLMMAADETLDVELARHAHRAGQLIRSEDDLTDLLQRHIALFFHCVFGNRDTALVLAEDIDKRVASWQRSWAKFVSRRNCSLARQLVGAGPTDLLQLERDYLECLDASMFLNAAQCAAFIASVHIDDGRITDAEEWLRRSTSVMEEHDIAAFPLDYFSGQIDHALIRGDEARARSHLRQMHESAHRYEFGRLRNDLLLYRLRVDQICGSHRVSPDDLAELLRFHEVAKSFGRHDDHMDVLWVALVSAGMGDDASRLLHEYLTIHRRERRPCRYFLRSRTASDPAWRLEGARALSPS
jgi:Predicted ATPase